MSTCVDGWQEAKETLPDESLFKSSKNTIFLDLPSKRSMVGPTSPQAARFHEIFAFLPFHFGRCSLKKGRPAQRLRRILPMSMCICDGLGKLERLYRKFAATMARSISSSGVDDTNYAAKALARYGKSRVFRVAFD